MRPDSTEADAEVDARQIDDEPFDAITTALEELSPEQSLLLINSFEPEPLYDVLERRGFTYETTHPEPDVWHVTIRHR